MHLINEFLGSNYTTDDVKGYYMQSLIEDARLNEFYNFFDESNMYDYVTVIPNAIEVIEKLNKKYELYICSSFVIPNVNNGAGNLIKNKCEWLKRNLPFLEYNQMIFMSQKQLLNADIRIDDHIKNLSGSGELKLLFTSYHNKELTNDELLSQGVIRVNNWLEIEAMLLS